MTIKKVKFPLTEQDKQTKPMDGESSPENVLHMARIFALQEKSELKNNNLLKKAP